jgi:antitoxin component YwqK of YwqJK toxin-antitoxin module
VRYFIGIVSIIILFFGGCATPSFVGGNQVKRTYFPKGQLKSEFIMNDASGRNGLLKEYGLDGELLAVTPIRNGLKHGIQKIYDKKGHVSVEIPYINGKKEGKQKAYYEDGRIWYILPFKNNRLHGHAIMYDRKGNIIKQAHYVNGEAID